MRRLEMALAAATRLSSRYGGAAACPCTRPLHHAAAPCRCTMPLHHAAGPCRWTMPLDHAAGPCRWTMPLNLPRADVAPATTCSNHRKGFISAIWHATAASRRLTVSCRAAFGVYTLDALDVERERRRSQRKVCSP